MDWSRSYRSRWVIHEIIPSTWSEGDILEGVSSFSIKRDTTDSAPLIETATMDVDQPTDADISDKWYKITLIADQAGSMEKHDIGVFLFESSSDEIDKKRSSSSLNGYSVLKPASERILDTGTYAPKGVNGANWAANMLRSVIFPPIEVDGSFTLDDHIVFDSGCTYLSAVWAVLDAGKFCIQIDGNGTVHVKPYPTEPDLVLDTTTIGMLQPNVKRDHDRSGIPNVYTAISGTASETVVNDDPDSRTSVPSRGRRIEVLDTSVQRVNGETLAAYARRKLEESSTVITTFQYTREYDPSVRPFSIVRGNVEMLGMSDDYRVRSQDLTCDKGITVSETVGKEVKEWSR